MKLNRIFLILATILLGGAAASAQEYSITLKFQGDGWREGLFIESATNVGNISGMEPEVFYRPTEATFEYKFKAPFETDVAEPGLNIAAAKGYVLNVELAPGQDLVNAQLGGDPNADYYLDGGAGAGGYSYNSKRKVAGLTPAQVGDISAGYNLTLWSPRMDGATFIVTVNKNSNMFGMKFLGYGFENGYEKDGETYYTAYDYIDMITQYPQGNQFARQSVYLTSDYQQFEYLNVPTVLQFALDFDNAEQCCKISCPGLKPGATTYEVKYEPGRYFGTTIFINIYSKEVIGKTFILQLATPGTEIPELEENADIPEPAIDPAPGTYAGFSGPVTITWEGCSITETPGNTSAISIKLNGTVADSNEWYWSYVDADGNPIWDDDPDPEPASGISIGMPFSWEDVNVYDIIVPEGMFTITDASGASGVNEVISLSYTGVTIYDDLTCNPTKGSELRSLTTFNMEWDNYEATLNPDCKDRICVTVLNLNTYETETVGYATIKADSNGKFTVTLDEPYSENGYVNVVLPEGMFYLTTNAGEILSPSVTVTYKISLFVVVPNDQAYLDEPFDSFGIYADNLTLNGDVSGIKLYTLDYEVYENDGYVEYAKAISATPVTDDTYGAGLKITFDKTYDQSGSARIVIPAGMLSLNGTVYNKGTTIDYYVTIPVEVEDPTATPENGSTLTELSSVILSWDESPLALSWMWEENGSKPFTLTFTPATEADEPFEIDITDCVEIISEEEEGDTWFPQITSSELVIKLKETYKTPGKYEIYVPADYVEIEKYEYSLNNELTLTYTIGSGSSGVEVTVAEEKDAIYNLHGQRVVNPHKGIYIVNGKKVVF